MDLPEFWSFNRRHDAGAITTRTLIWSGPHAWPGYGSTDPDVPACGGVYLTTFAHEDGFILRSAGVSKAIRRRLRQHEYEFLMGRYTVLDPQAAHRGVRRELWHGWGGYARSHPEQRERHLPQIQQWARAEMAACRLFVGQRLVGDEQDMEARLRERVEFAIIHAAYASRQPWGDLVDGGMRLSGSVYR
ncbi:MAG: hypothetical protein QG612_1604 [Pseudomonadota bacterium]|nr:hypothetical protein [Pseudomonadota bacterium]